MAVDQAIAEAAATGAVPPTLRFYRWNPPTISLGRHQKLADVDETQTAARGYDLGLRATGGRAILHVDELTYSVPAQLKIRTWLGALWTPTYDSATPCCPVCQHWA